MKAVATVAPGKLVLFGEYSVLEGHPALAVSVNRYAKCEIYPNHQFELDTQRFGIFRRGTLLEAPPFARAQLLERSELGLKVRLNTDEFYQDASRNSGKLGLGSSAAISVALAAGLTYLDTEELDAQLLFEQTHALHRRVQGVGSGIDIAAACFGGTFCYQFSKSRKTSQQLNQELILKTCSGTASFKPLKAMSKSILGVYLGHGASTPALVRQVHRLKQNDRTTYNEFMTEIGAISALAMNAWNNADRRELHHYAEKNNAVLRALGGASQATIIPKALDGLNNVLAPEGAVAKTTGAGGGDIAWVLGIDEEHETVLADMLRTEWSVFKLEVAPHGVQAIG